MKPITPELLAAIALDRPSPLMAVLAPELAAQLAGAGIDTALRGAHFLAQACIETAGFSRLEENLNYSALTIAKTWPRLAPRAHELEHKPEALADAAYADHAGNGDEASGDGWRFRGRGLLQLTGRFNYGLATDALRRDPQWAGLDLVAAPDDVVAPAMAVRVAIAFWNFRHCSEAADEDDGVKVTRLINGGLNALQDRLFCKHRALKLLEA